jgi:hypothetical protein
MTPQSLLLLARYQRQGKRFKPLLYLTPWHYIPRKKLTRGERIRLALEELGPIFIKPERGPRDRDRMIVGFTTTYAISAYHH